MIYSSNNYTTALASWPHLGVDYRHHRQVQKERKLNSEWGDMHNKISSDRDKINFKQHLLSLTRCAPHYKL